MKIKARHFISQDTDSYLDVECEVNYVGDPRVWRQRVWLDKVDKMAVVSDVIEYSANGGEGFEEVQDLPADISVDLTKQILIASRKVIDARRVDDILAGVRALLQLLETQ